MILPEPKVSPFEPITPEQAKDRMNEGVWVGDDPALKLVIQDCQRAEQAEQSKQFVMGWLAAQSLFESPFSPNFWPGTQSEAASMPLFTVMTSVNGFVNQVMPGMFYENPPFMVEERPGTTAQAARAQSALLGYQLEDINFRNEILLGVRNCALYGTALFQYGWEKFTKERKIIKRKEPVKIIPSTIPGGPPTRISTGELETEIIEEVVDRPCFEHIVNLREILVDPTLNVPDIRKAKYLIRRRYMTWEELDKLRERDGYNLPSREKLLELFLPPQEPVEAATNELGSRSPMWDARAFPRWEEATADPLQKPLEVLERWDKDTYIVVIQKKLVIYNDRNVYGKIPFFSIGLFDVPGAFWSIGMGRTVGTEQRLQTGLLNNYLNVCNLNLMPPLVRVRGKSIPTQSIRIGPGKIIEVDAQGDLAPLSKFPVANEAIEMIGMSNARVAQFSGSSPIASGDAGSSGHSNLARTATGAQGILQGASSTPSEFVDKLAYQVFVPFLYETMEMNRAMLPESQLNFIMDEELKHVYLDEDGNPGDLLDILKADVKFTILAGSKMQVRRNMSQALPLLSQNLANPAVAQNLQLEAKKIDWLEITKLWFMAAEIPNVNDVIVDMTPRDMARVQAQSQGGVVQQKFQAQSALEAQKAAQQSQLADDENVARAARDALREGWKKAVEPDLLTGTPNTGPVGFGGNL